MYNIEYSKLAEKQIKKLSPQIQKRIFYSVERSRIRPHSYVKKLIGNPLYSLRVEDYRVIMDIQDGNFLIFVIEVDHRKRIYK